MKRASFSSYRLRPVHAVLFGLLCTAIAAPILSNLAVETSTTDVQRGFVSAERPIDRILAGTALGSRRLTPQEAIPVFPAVTPHRTAPEVTISTVPNIAPDQRLASLLPVPDRQTPPVEVVATQPASNLYPVPRRKPMRSVVEIPEADSVAIALPTAIETTELAAPALLSEVAAPRIALVVTAAGIHEATTRKAIDALPDTVTLAFAPIGKKTGALARSAIADGHTILAEVPMEPINIRRDPGEPLTLRVSNTNADNIVRLDKALARVPGAVGISSYLGAKFSRSEAAASPVVDEIASRDLFLFENQPNSQSRLGPLARTRNVDYAASTVAIDTQRDTAHMLDRLSTLESQARRDGIAIGVATTYRETIATLEDWVAKAEKRGIIFVPVTRIGDAG